MGTATASSGLKRLVCGFTRNQLIQIRFFLRQNEGKSLSDFLREAVNHYLRHHSVPPAHQIIQQHPGDIPHRLREGSQ